MLDGWIGKSTVGTAAPDRAALDAWKLARLRETLDYARRRSSFYRERFSACRICSFEEFAALPFTTVEDLRLYGAQMLCIPPNQVDRVKTLSTSGSTGAPKRIYFSAGDQERTIDYFFHGMAEFTGPGSRVMSLFPGESRGSLNDLLSQALTRLGAHPLLFGYPPPERYPALLDAILEQKADFLVGAAESVSGAARCSAELGCVERLAGQVKGVLLAATYVSPENRADIACLWRCPVYEHYGMTETALGGAVGCSAPCGYHEWESGVYYEIIDPTSGQPVPEGEYGEIVVTTLGQEAMPFLRYRTGDISRFLPDPCPCGSVLRRLDRVMERGVSKRFTNSPP